MDTFQPSLLDYDLGEAKITTNRNAVQCPNRTIEEYTLRPASPATPLKRGLPRPFGAPLPGGDYFLGFSYNKVSAMLQILNKKVEAIGVSEINAQDRTFAISPPWWPIDPLIESVRLGGILSPLHIQAIGRNQKRIITGFRRYEAARRIGLQVVPCIISVEEDSPTTLFLQALLDNLAVRSFHPLEKAIALVKLFSQFNVAPEKVVEEFLPLLGIRGDRFHLDHYLRLGALPERLQRSLADSLEPEVALKLARWKEEEQNLFLTLIRKYQLGKNRQLEVFILLDELRAKQGKNSMSIWEQSQASQIDEDEHLPQAERWMKITGHLRRLRFPLLSQHERQYDTLRAALKIPPQIQFQMPPFFEGDRIRVGMTFSRREELHTLADKLKEIAEKKELEEILKLL